MANVWNSIDLVVFTLAVTSFSLFVAIAVRENVVQDAMFGQTTNFVSFSQLAMIENIWRDVNAVLLMILLLIVSTLDFR